MKTAYVTGGTGCLGRNLITVLLREGWRVIIAHRQTSDLTPLKALPLETREVILEDSASVLRSLPYGIEAVFHVAAHLSHWARQFPAQYQTNVCGTRTLVDAALTQHVGRFVYTSTGATRPYESWGWADAQRIQNHYVRTKRLAELCVLDGVRRGLNAVILRPVVLLGAYDSRNYAQLFTALASQRWMPVLPGAMEFCHAGTVAEAHVRAYASGLCGACYMLSGPSVSWLQLSQAIARLVHVPLPRHVTPRALLLTIAHLRVWCAAWTGEDPLLTPQLVRLLSAGGHTPLTDIRTAYGHLGYASPSLEAMLDDCYAWLCQEGHLFPSQPPR